MLGSGKLSILGEFRQWKHPAGIDQRVENCQHPDLPPNGYAYVGKCEGTRRAGNRNRCNPAVRDEEIYHLTKKN